jgi:branched-chain amino acid transport system permease protein
VDANLWLIALVALPVIILGGLDSLHGAVVAGLGVGVLQETLSTYQHTFPVWLGGNVATLTPFAVMMLVLLVRPYGLFGTREVERV